MLKLEYMETFLYDVLRISHIPDIAGRLSIYRSALAENTGIMASCIG